MKKLYFPAIVCSQHICAIDALLSLYVPHDEAMDLMIASWSFDYGCLVTNIDGGRTVAAIKDSQNNWIACNAYLNLASESKEEAERQLKKVAKRGKKGMIGSFYVAPTGK